MYKIFLLCMGVMCLVGCTISFQNVDTHGPSEDLIDENQSNAPDVAPTVSVPISPK